MKEEMSMLLKILGAPLKCFFNNEIAMEEANCFRQKLLRDK